MNSPFKGVVEKVPVNQGSQVAIGDPLVTVTDLSIVWVWVEFYENEAALIAKGQKLTLTTNTYPSQTFEGAVSLVDPIPQRDDPRRSKSRVEDRQH